MRTHSNYAGISAKYGCAFLQTTTNGCLPVFQNAGDSLYFLQGGNIMRYICELCGTVYDEAEGVAFDQLPADFSCPSCGSEKEAFTPVHSQQRIRPQKSLEEGYTKYPEEYQTSQR